MPASARSALIDLDASLTYHCIATCVRRAYLCGQDDHSGQNYDHRKEWLLERLDFVAQTFCIDVCAFAVMSNHFHVVLRVAPDRAAALSEEAVLRRYGRLFKTAARDVRELSASNQRERVTELRERLTDIGWFMRTIKEYVSRRANKEDKCTGRFWEGRFKSQTLLDDSALYAAMGFVDLNPVRAGVADSLESSPFTSIQQRLREAAGKKVGKTPVTLVGLKGERSRKRREALGLRFDDYVELLEWTVRAAGAKEGGRIRAAPPEVLASLQIDPHAWLPMMTQPGLGRLTTLGTAASIEAEAERQGKRWLKGARAGKSLFLSEA